MGKMSRTRAAMQEIADHRIGFVKGKRDVLTCLDCGYSVKLNEPPIIACGEEKKEE